MLSLTVRHLVVLLILSSCSQFSEQGLSDNNIPVSTQNFQGKVQLENLRSRKGFKLLLIDDKNITQDQAIFQYIPYRLDTADVDRDGNTDVLVGLIKKTTFDPVEKKRLFILRIDDGALRPLWLGSKVCQELVNFKAKKNGLVKTLEKTKLGNYAIGEYKWQGFGLTLIQYVHQEISIGYAQQLFND